MSKFISVGKILNFHGIQGEAKVGFSKNQQDFFLSLNKVFVKVENDYNPLKITRSRLNKTFAIVKFKEFQTVNDVEEFKGCDLFLSRTEVEENLDKADSFTRVLFNITDVCDKEKSYER